MKPPKLINIYTWILFGCISRIQKAQGNSNLYFNKKTLKKKASYRVQWPTDRNKATKQPS